MSLKIRRGMEFAPVRLLAYLGALLLCVVVPAKIFDLILLVLYPNPFLRSIEAMAFGVYLKVAIAIVSTLVYCGMVIAFEKRPVSELAGRRSVQELLVGMLLSIGLMAAVCGILAMQGGVAWVESSRLGEALSLNLSSAVLAAAGVAVSEEILFRAVLFRILQQGSGTGVALGLSSLLFGLLHSLNAGTSIASALSVAVEAGLPLAMAYVVTQRLWLPIGLHFGWDLIYGRLFGGSASGLPVEGLLMLSSRGAEISVVTLLPSLALAGYLGWLASLRGAWRPIRLRLRLDDL